MLTELHISNFAIIDRQSVSFGPGLNVISGETGAGKSIVLHAMELILGGRPSTQAIRSGAESLEVEALFDLRAAPLSILDQLPDIARGDELSIARSVSASGRGKVYLNGRLSTVAMLEEVTSRLVNICGQGQHVRLLDPSYHLDLIDDFAGNEKLRGEYREHYDAWKAIDEQIRSAEKKLEQSVLRRAELEHILSELAGLELSAGAREALEEEVRRRGNAEGLLARGRELEETLSGEGAAFAQLGAGAARLQEMAKLDSGLGRFLDLFQSARTELRECAADVAAYVSKISLDEAALSGLREKLAELARLERKYRTNSAGLLELRTQASAELELLSDENALPRLKADAAQRLEKVKALSQKLTLSRRESGRKLSKTVEGELRDLAMQATIELSMEKGELSDRGEDKVEILISANRGEPRRALRHVASGGELARITLVLKNALSERTGVNVLVFDEVDSGVSGPTARAVGEKLKTLAKRSQVICITHLAQVASLADHHFLVSKKVDNRTVSLIRELSKDEKIEEIARMLAGYKITKASRESARELLSSKV